MSENKPTPTVECDENGVPESWPLVRAGPVPLRKNGEDYVLELTSKDLSGIISCQWMQGRKIPPSITDMPLAFTSLSLSSQRKDLPDCYTSLPHDITDILRQEAPTNIADRLSLGKQPNDARLPPDVHFRTTFLRFFLDLA